MNDRHSVIECGNCGNRVNSMMPWRCTSCGFDNHRTELYSFQYKCQKCGGKPTELVCPECSKSIRLSGARGTKLVATAIPPPKKTTMPKEGPSARTRREHMEEMDRLDRAIAKANKENELKKAKNPAPENPEATLQDALEKELKKELADGMRLENAFAKLERDVTEQYKNDEDNLEKARMHIKLMKERRIPT